MNGAVEEFANAAKLDPTFFEAQMNYAAVNLSFRGFEQAQSAYQKALEMRPNDYDAHLGLALALRGHINDSNYDTQVAAVQARARHLQEARRRRPDASTTRGFSPRSTRRSRAAMRTSDRSLQSAKTTSILRQQGAGKNEYDGP